MKRTILFLSFILACNLTSFAQRAGTSDKTGGINYQHLFLNDEVDYSGGFFFHLGSDYFITESFYTGFSLGYSYGIVTSGSSGFRLSVKVHDIRIPLHAGVASSDGRFKFNTGPFIDFSLAGKAEVSYGGEQSETRLKDMDVKRVSLGWGVNAELFDILKVGYGVKMTDSPYGEGGEVHFITVGFAF